MTTRPPALAHPGHCLLRGVAGAPNIRAFANTTTREGKEMNLEQTIDAVAPYMRERIKDIPVMQSETNYRAACFPLSDLVKHTGASAVLLGKIRKRFKGALAQALTPGRDPEFQVMEQSYFGRAAIAVRRSR